jgi:lysophospholipase L1-like esterase
MQRIPASDPRLSWPGAVELEQGDGWVRPWRLPLAEQPLFHPDLVRVAGAPSGVRLAFITDAATVVLRIAQPDAGARPLAVMADGQHLGDLAIPPDGRVAIAAPGGRRRYEIWLPQNAPFRLAAVEIDEGAQLESAPRRGLRWITYGSSISHCNEPASPVLTWPARVALGRGLDLTSLGLSGQCHLDPLVARVIGRLGADAISIKAGVNIWGNGSLNLRTYRWNLIAFVRLVREAHPTVPLALISPIFAPLRETTENKAGMTHGLMRREMAEAVATLRAGGDANLHHLDGLELLGPADVDRLPDQVHPDTAGYGLMAERFLAKLGPVLFPA